MRWNRFAGRRRRERDRAEEMRAHVDLLIEQLVARGMPPDAARRQARLAFGNARAKLEEVNEMTRLPILDALTRDVRFAIRVLRKSPAFTLTALLTLGLAIGGSTAVFTLADSILLAPLPYPASDRLAMVTDTAVSAGGRTAPLVGQDGTTWDVVHHDTALWDAAVYSGIGGVGLVVHDAAMLVQQQRVSAGYFRVLGVRPFIGREFTDDEDRAGGPAAAVLSDGLWRRAFGGDPAIVGRRIFLRGEPYTVVGVTAPGFVNLPGNEDVDLWTPIRASASGEGAGVNYEIIARLRPGVTWSHARAAMAALSDAALRQRQPAAGVTITLGLTSPREALEEDARVPIVLLGAAVGLVLLVACVNLAALLLVRGADRAQELAVRMALGVGRGAIVQQLVVEAMVLGVAGGVVGVAFGAFGLDALKHLGGHTFSEWDQATLNARVLLATTTLSIATGLAFGLLPALQSSRVDLHDVLVDAGSRTVAGGRRPITRRLLVAAETALAVVLLVGAGLLLRTFVKLRSVDPGFDPAALVIAQASLQDARYHSSSAVNRLFDQSLAALAAAPGVESAAVSLGTPFTRLLNDVFSFTDDPPDRRHIENVAYVTPGYFETFGIRLRRGRSIEPDDRADAPPVAVVNDAFVRIYSPDRDPLGRTVREAPRDRRIIGVVADAWETQQGFSTAGFSDGLLTTPPEMFIPAAQTSDAYLALIHTWLSPTWTVRLRPGTASGAIIRRAIQSVDPLLPVSDAKTMADVMAGSVAYERLLASLVAALAAVALLLVAVGQYGVIAYAIRQRRRELGVRLALGATPGRAIRDVVVGGLWLSGAGAMAGGLLSLPVGSLLASLLWGVRAHDAATYLGVVAMLLGVAVIASLIPALKIARLDPTETMRS